MPSRLHGARNLFRWRCLRTADGRLAPRLRQEWAAYWRCGRRGHRYGPEASVHGLGWVRRCLNGCGCLIVRVPVPFDPRA